MIATELLLVGIASAGIASTILASSDKQKIMKYLVYGIFGLLGLLAVIGIAYVGELGAAKTYYFSYYGGS